MQFFSKAQARSAHPVWSTRRGVTCKTRFCNFIRGVGLHDVGVQPMSGDEVFVSLISAVLVIAIWLGTLVRILRFSGQGLPRASSTALVFALPVCLAIVFWILRNLASHDVREDGRYIAMYGFMGAAWIGMAPALFLPGISLRDDFLERRNNSAAIVLLGYMLASTFCFAGGNIGDGPGWWVVVFCAVLANITLMLLWLGVNWLAPVSDRVTIDRDPAIATRVAGFFIGSGLILGRAVAGDWLSAKATLHDFGAKAWPVLILFVLFTAAERRATPRFTRDEQAVFARGIFPALIYILIAAVVVLRQGSIQ